MRKFLLVPGILGALIINCGGPTGTEEQQPVTRSDVIGYWETRLPLNQDTTVAFLAHFMSDQTCSLRIDVTTEEFAQIGFLPFYREKATWDVANDSVAFQRNTCDTRELDLFNLGWTQTPCSSDSARMPADISGNQWDVPVSDLAVYFPSEIPVEGFENTNLRLTRRAN